MWTRYYVVGGVGFRLGTLLEVAAVLLWTGVTAAMVVRRTGGRGLFPVLLALPMAQLGAHAIGVLAFAPGRLESLGTTPWWTTVLQGPSSILGSILGAMAGLWLGTRFARAQVVDVFDSAAYAFPCAEAVGRIACFAHGCCVGAPTALPWGVRYPATSMAGLMTAQQRVHPAVLYEAALCLLLFACMFAVRRANARPGVQAALSLVGYGAIRFAVQWLRLDSQPSAWGMSRAHWVASSLVAAGAALWYWSRRCGVSGNARRVGH